MCIFQFAYCSRLEFALSFVICICVCYHFATVDCEINYTWRCWCGYFGHSPPSKFFAAIYWKVSSVIDFSLSFQLIATTMDSLAMTQF